MSASNKIAGSIANLTPGLTKLPGVERFAALLQIIREATARIADLRTQVSARGRRASTAALGVPRSSAAMSGLASGQTIAVKCDCACSSARSSTSATWLSTVQRASLAIAKPLEPLPTGVFKIARALTPPPWLAYAAKAAEQGGTGSSSTEPAAFPGGPVLGRMPGFLSSAGRVDRGRRPGSGAVAMFTFPGWEPIGRGVVDAPAGAYLARGYWERIQRTLFGQWEAVKRIINIAEDRIATFSRETLAFARCVTTLRVEAIERRLNAETGPIQSNVQVQRRMAVQNRPALAIGAAPRGLRGSDDRFNMRFPGSSAIVAMASAPAMSTAALSAIPAWQRGAETASGGSVIINSSPSITINANDASDVERRVLEALRQHRDALYGQWHREVSRRQRVEF